MRAHLTRGRRWWSVAVRATVVRLVVVGLVVVGLVVVGLVGTALVTSLHKGRTEDAGPALTGDPSEGFLAAPLGPPQPGGAASFAAQPPDGARPGRGPAQAADPLRGLALPTNQWWSSALTGPLTQPLWAPPLALRVAEAGVQLSAAGPRADRDAIVTPFLATLLVGGPAASVEVAGYGAFHVVLRVHQGDGGTVDITLVQGSPLVYARFSHPSASVTVAPGAQRVDLAGSRARVVHSGQTWDVVAPPGVAWQTEGGRLTAPSQDIAIARVPDGVDESEWLDAIGDSATNPVVDTAAAMDYHGADGSVIQTLTMVRARPAPSPWALLPHQQAGLVAGPHRLAGRYGSARGELSLARAASIAVRVPMPGLLPSTPTVDLSPAARSAVHADLDRDLADPSPGGGSYFGFKELARLATIADVARAAGAPEQRREALSRLRPLLVDWLTYAGPTDERSFAYDPTWGGLIAVPAEFGSQDYNDHHFQYGYLVRAAAVMAEADPGFGQQYGGAVDLVLRDYAGSRENNGLPPFRVFNAYLGSSAASGFAPFADGNNQESSSEAVAAWAAIVQWGLVRDDEALVTYGVTHYALEAATARAYWLGEGTARPAGYAHTGAGIVWDAKIDYATWFDPRPESIHGIQLLPLTFGSLYRADAPAAAARAVELDRAVGGPPRVWGDLFAADLALADPPAALQRLGPALPREDSTSRAMVRYFIEALAAWGPPQPGIVADAPIGLAFGDRDHPTLVGANPAPGVRPVSFRRAGDLINTLTLAPTPPP